MGFFRQRLLRRLLSWAANYTPDTVYFPRAVVAAVAEEAPNVGDVATATFRGFEHNGRRLGSFRVYIERIPDEES